MVGGGLRGRTIDPTSRSPADWGLREPSRTIGAVRLPRLSPRAYRVVTVVAAVALAVIIVTGAGVRLTGSGLGCSDWPSCEQNQFHADMGDTHAAIEYLNRLFTGFVSIAVAVAVLGSLLRKPRRRDLTWWSLGLVAGVLGQIVLGGLTVLFHLSPPFVIGHFVLSMILMWNAIVLVERAGHDGSPGLPLVPPRVRTLGRALVAAGAASILSGTVVTGTGPHGGDESVERLPFELVEVARTHSLIVWAFLALATWTLWELHRHGSPLEVDRRAKLLVAAIVVQGGIGYAQYALGVPPLLVIFHIAGSVVVWVAVLRFQLGLTAHPAERPAADDHDDPRGLGRPLTPA
jgi:cytochrome c oxidase assembly protein subunit 15